MPTIMPLYQIGRSHRCDIVLDDRAVSKRHAELLTLDDGRLYLTDCASRNGTHVLREGRWRAIRQGFVRRDERVRFGKVALTVADLLRKIPHQESTPGARPPASDHLGAHHLGAQNPPANSLPQGPVKRHPKTGEIIPS